MRLLLNFQIMLILNCFILDRVSSDNTTQPEVLHNLGFVVGIFLHKSELTDFIAVGIAVSSEVVVTTCTPLVKTFRGLAVELYDTKLYSVVANMDSKSQERMAKAVNCFYTDGWDLSKIGKPDYGQGDLGVLDLAEPFETSATDFITVSSNVRWDVGARCKLYYYDVADEYGFVLQSLDVVPLPNRKTCTDFLKAETGIEPSTNQLCGFPLFPQSPACDVILPGSPVFCPGSLLIGLTENSSSSTLAGRCLFVVDAFSAGSIEHRLPVVPAESAATSKAWQYPLLILPALTILYYFALFQDSRNPYILS